MAEYIAFNAITEKPYNQELSTILIDFNQKRGFLDPRFLTLNQANNAGGMDAYAYIPSAKRPNANVPRKSGIQAQSGIISIHLTDFITTPMGARLYNIEQTFGAIVHTQPHTPKNIILGGTISPLPKFLIKASQVSWEETQAPGKQPKVAISPLEKYIMDALKTPEALLQAIEELKLLLEAA